MRALRGPTVAGNNRFVFSQPARQLGKAYTLTGPEAVTAGQIASAISQATGRTITYIDMPEEAMREGMLAEGLP